jgi:hypothetical protein
MKLVNLCFVILLIACSHASTEVLAEQSMTKQSDQGLVYYFGFEVERITGIPENQIEQYGCKFSISRNDFEQSLLTAPDQVANIQYNKLDIRAKAIFLDKQYFIDRAGVVSDGQRYVLLNKVKFASHLKSVGKC